MKIVILITAMISNNAFANTDCKEAALASAVQAEAMRSDAKGFNSPIDATVKSVSGDEQTWTATIVGNDGKNVDYSVKQNKTTCEILEEPIRAR